MSRVVSAIISLLVLGAPGISGAAFHFSNIDEAMSGVGSDPTVQFVEIRILQNLQLYVSNTRLTAFNCDGSTATVQLLVPGNVAVAGPDVRWIMASPSGATFLSTLGITPDFTFTGTIDPTCGNICWGAPVVSFFPADPSSWDPTMIVNGANPDYVDCLAYGGYTGPLKTGQPVFPGPLGDGMHSVHRVSGTTFALDCPTPQNNAGQTGGLTGCVPPPTTTTTTTSTTLPSTNDELLTGAQLTIKDNAKHASKRHALLVSTDSSITLGAGDGSADDPRTAGATLRIATTAGDAFTASYELPAGSWKIIGASGKNVGYRFKSAPSASQPVTQVVLKRGKLLRIAAKGAGLATTLGANPAPVDVSLTVGTTRYCLAFGGSVSFKAGKSFVAKGAPAPASCTH
jgi:hypothetical protein